jgi:predicted transposase YdaD
MTDKPHDRIFRKMLSVPSAVRQILEGLLPADLLAQIDWNTFEMPKIAGINEKLSETREDVLYRAKLCGTTSCSTTSSNTRPTATG